MRERSAAAEAEAVATRSCHDSPTTGLAKRAREPAWPPRAHADPPRELLTPQRARALELLDDDVDLAGERALISRE